MSGLVAVALPSAPDQLFTYRVPQGMSEPAVGARVVVPFGRRRLVGFVVSLPPTADVDEASLRNVDELLDEEPALTPALLKLATFIADYYVCPLGDVLRAMHPGMSVPARRARITAAGRLALGGGVRGARRHEALVALDASRDGLTTTALARKVGKGGATVLRDLERLGLVEIVAADAHEVQEATVVAFRAAPDAPLVSAPAKRATIGERARALLAESPEGLTVAEIAAKLGAQEASVRSAMGTLERHGAVVRAERVLQRSPASAPASPEGAPAHDRPLTPGQAEAFAAATRLVDAGEFGVVLVEGVTGSGKTEIYLRALEHCIAQGKTGIYLVPEISITPLLLRTVRERFGKRTAILHSGLSEGERRDERARALAGEADVVVGARSAIFAPMPRLGLVVVDEEHESSYKQDSQPRYHGRDVAVMRARLENAAVILGSATPSLESARNAETGRYRLVRMTERAGGASPATVELVDMREEWKATKGAAISRPLRKALDETLKAGRQAMILLNRRGWADFVLCRECGEPERCDNCAVTLTVHLRTRALLCHYCDLHRDIPETCRQCGGSFLQNVGQGTEQLEEELGKLLPGVEIARLDADVARKRGAATHVLSDFEAGRTKILVGTQMIAKGHDFPGVTLVGVLQADRALWLPDFRAAERTFQLLTQVAGRAGRRKDLGRVIVQTYSPQHPAIALAQTQDYRAFYEAETGARQALGYPPFRRLAALLVSGPERDDTERHAQRLADALRAAASADVKVLGPAPAPLSRLKERWRFHVLLKSSERASAQAAIRRALAQAPAEEPLRVEVDVDPQSLL